MIARRLPTPDDLADAPELATLAALDEILELALRVLVSVHPQLGDAECPAWARSRSPASEAADRILDAARPLAHALHAYRSIVTRRRADEIDADLPF